MKNIIDNIKLYFFAIKILREVKVAYENLKKENEELKLRLGNPRDVVEKCFTRGIQWFDWNQLPLSDRRKNYNEVQKFLESKFFNNLKNYLIATGAQQALLEDTKDSDKIRDVQMVINGYELFWKELESITDPDKPKDSEEDIYNGI